MRPDNGALSIEFDDIIYSLQRYGGITQYWREMTRGIAERAGVAVRHTCAPAWQRLWPVHSTARVFHSSYLRVARGRGTRTVITVHDLAYELGHLGKTPRSRLARIERRRAYFSADALVCVSDSTRRDLLAVYPALAGRCPISVVHHGPTLKAGNPGHSTVQLDPRLSQPFVLFVGGRAHYKNFETAVRAFARSRLAAQRGQLVCTGSALTPDETRMIARHTAEDNVICVGNVDRAALVALYQHAHCLLYPSRFEGFGMPVLEAMTLGCPVVATAATSIPEIAGDAALLFEDGDTEGLAAALQRLMNPSVRSAMITAGRARAISFSWTRSVDAHLRVYRSLA